MGEKLPQLNFRFGRDAGTLGCENRAISLSLGSVDNLEKVWDYLLGSLTLAIFAKPELIQLSPALRRRRIPGRGKTSREDTEPTYHLDGSRSPRVCRRCVYWPA